MKKLGKRTLGEAETIAMYGQCPCSCTCTPCGCPCSGGSSPYNTGYADTAYKGFSNFMNMFSTDSSSGAGFSR